MYLIRSLLVAGAVQLAVLLALSYLSGHWIPSFLAGMRFHLAIAMVGIAAVNLFIQRDKIMMVLCALGCLVFAHSIYLTQSVAQGTPEPSASAARLKVLSFNILLENQRIADVAERIATTDAEVAFILESAPLRPHMKRLSEIFPHRVGCGIRTKFCDLMILSKLPLEQIDVHTLSRMGRDRLMKATVSLDGHPINIAAIHLTKPFFGPIHIHELDHAARYLGGIKGPMILAGDFNSSVLASDMQRFMQAMKLKTVSFEPNTWPVIAPWVGLPIDHIMTRQPLAIQSLERMPDALGSNHFGLSAEIVLVE